MEQLLLKDNKGIDRPSCIKCYENGEIQKQAHYGIENNGKKLRLYCAQHGKELNMTCLKTDSRSLIKINRESSIEEFINVFSQDKYILEKKMYDTVETIEITMDDEIELVVASCEVKPRKRFDKQKKSWEVYGIYNLNTCRKNFKRFDNEDDANKYYNEQKIEFEKNNKPKFKLTIRYLLEHDIHYFMSYFRIPLPMPVEYEYKQISIEAYYLGLWLGDGNKNSATITTIDEEIVDYIKSYAGNLDMVFKIIRDDREGKCPMYKIIGKKGKGKGNNYLINKLRELNIFENKHIPEKYLYNSIKIRRELLAGLIDSDGTLESSQTYSFTQSLQHVKIINDVEILAKELGFRVKRGDRDTVCTNARDGPKICPSIRLFITGDFSKIPTKLPRKQAKERTIHSDMFVWNLKTIGKEDITQCPITNQNIHSANNQLFKLFNTIKSINLKKNKRVAYKEVADYCIENNINPKEISPKKLDAIAKNNLNFELSQKINKGCIVKRYEKYILNKKTDTIIECIPESCYPRNRNQSYQFYRSLNTKYNIKPTIKQIEESNFNIIRLLFMILN